MLLCVLCIYIYIYIYVVKLVNTKSSYNKKFFFSFFKSSKEIQPVHPKGNQSWIFTGRTDAEAVTPILRPPDAKNWLIWKDPDAGKDWRQEKKGDDRGWDGWMVSLTQWTWVWVNSGSWWWTGRPGALQFMGSQRVSDDWETELNWDDRCSAKHYHCDYHFMMYVGQIMVYTLNLHSTVCQLYMNKSGRKR